MFTIDSILSSKKKDDSIAKSRDSSQTLLSDSTEDISTISQTPVLSGPSITTIAKPIAVRPGVIIEPALGFQRPSASSFLLTEPSIPTLDETGILPRPQSSPLDLHTCSVRSPPTQDDRYDLSNEYIDVCSSISPISEGSDSMVSPAQCTPSIVSSGVFISESNSMLRRRPEFLEVASHSGTLEARRYYSRQGSTTSTTPSDPSPTSDHMIPTPSSFNEYDNYQYASTRFRYPLPKVTNPSHERTSPPQFMAPRIVPSGVPVREIPGPRMMEPLVQNLPSTSMNPMNPMMLRHLCERRPPHFYTLFDPGSTYPYPGPGLACHSRSRRRGGQVRFTGVQTRRLEEVFAVQKYITPVHRRQLAEELGLHERQVKTWFQNRRAKWRKVSVHGEGSIPEGDRSSASPLHGTPSLEGREHDDEDSDHGLHGLRASASSLQE
ncbi:Homeobox domain [Trinorchestia longiramus]|nr:Homeobox domain [Trinorchestia longiramus]